MVLTALLASPATGQTPESSGAFWPAFDVHVSLPPSLKILAFGELKAEEFAYRQANFGASVGYQMSRIVRPHRVNIDSDKEHHLVVGAGYEHLETVQSGVAKFENRTAVDATRRLRSTGRLLPAERNRVEFRRVNGDYSTRYRNRLTAEYDLEVNDIPFTPHASSGFFYDITTGDWTKARSTLLPRRRSRRQPHPEDGRESPAARRTSASGRSRPKRSRRRAGSSSAPISRVSLSSPCVTV
jgi:hypothetical protein